MMKLLIPILFFMVALAGMLAALHWSKYKRRPSGCCGAHKVCEFQGEDVAECDETGE
jgi:hypothetical protein